MTRKIPVTNKKKSNGGNLGFEEKLWQAADKMRGHMDPTEYKHVKVLGDETLRSELVATVKKNVTIDWTVKESVKAKLRTMVKRILRKYGYPPDKQEKATQTVLSQAELLCTEWAV